MNIVEIKDYDNQGGMTQEDALKEAKAKGLRLLTNKEMDAILQDKKLYDKYYRFLPCWTGTRVEYKGTECTVIENGKTTKMKIPENDGWYEVNELGLPFGKPSNSENPKARYLWRRSEYSGLVARDWDGYWLDGIRRGVYLVLWGDGVRRLGVLATKAKPGEVPKHKHEWVCATCGIGRK